METMRRRSWWLIPILATMLTFSACSESTPEPAPTATSSPSATVEATPSEVEESGGLCANPLYPVAPAAKHAYLGRGGPVGDYTFTTTITEVRADGFTIVTEFDGVTVTQNWACSEAGLRALDYGGGPAGRVSVEGSEASYITREVEGLTLPHSVAAGNTWSQNFALTFTQSIPDLGEISADGTATQEYEALGLESVSVAAGTFEAMKVAVTTTLSFTMVIEEVEIPAAFTSSGYSWYAPGVGWIKSMDVSEIMGVTSESSVELQSYSLP